MIQQSLDTMSVELYKYIIQTKKWGPYPSFFFNNTVHGVLHMASCCALLWDHNTSKKKWEIVWAHRREILHAITSLSVKKYTSPQRPIIIYNLLEPVEPDPSGAIY